MRRRIRRIRLNYFTWMVIISLTPSPFSDSDPLTPPAISSSDDSTFIGVERARERERERERAGERFV